MSDELFAEPDELFASVDALYRCFTGVDSDAGLQPVSLSNTAAADSVNTVATLAAGLPGSIAPQMELLARSIRFIALDVLTADYTPLTVESEGGDDD